MSLEPFQFRFDLFLVAAQPVQFLHQNLVPGKQDGFQLYVLLPVEVLPALFVGEDVVIVQVGSIGFQSGKLPSEALVFG